MTSLPPAPNAANRGSLPIRPRLLSMKMDPGPG
jgi:hypothetical protein